MLLIVLLNENNPISMYALGLWTPTYDIQSFCWINPEVPCEKEEDALFIRCHHTGGKCRETRTLI